MWGCLLKTPRNPRGYVFLGGEGVVQKIGHQYPSFAVASGAERFGPCLMSIIDRRHPAI